MLAVLMNLGFAGSGTAIVVPPCSGGSFDNLTPMPGLTL